MSRSRRIIGFLVYALILALPITSALNGPFGESPGADTPQALAAAWGSQEAPSVPAGTPADWWASVQANIGQSEYDITWQDTTCLPDIPAGYQAPNRAQDLRTYFTPTGARVIPRTETVPSWQFGLALIGYAEGQDVQVSANRIEYHRESANRQVSEWYINAEDGLEQGFTVSGQRPAASDQPGTTALDLVISGGLVPHLTTDGTAIEFTTAEGVAVLRYGDLSAADSAGHSIPVQIGLLPANPTPGFTDYVLRITPSTPISFPATITAHLISPAGLPAVPGLDRRRRPGGR
jgi:hypothetical protein